MFLHLHFSFSQYIFKWFWMKNLGYFVIRWCWYELLNRTEGTFKKWVVCVIDGALLILIKRPAVEGKVSTISLENDVCSDMEMLTVICPFCHLWDDTLQGANIISIENYQQWPTVYYHFICRTCISIILLCQQISHLSNIEEETADQSGKTCLKYLRY